MKNNDIAALVLAVAFSLGVSWFVLNAVIPKPSAQQSEVEVIDPISETFPEPDKNVFAEGYLNPTELIEIDEADNKQPFNQ